MRVRRLCSALLPPPTRATTRWSMSLSLSPAHDLVAYLVWLQITGTTTTERAQAAPFALRLRLVPVQSISLGVQEKPWIGIISYISS